MSAALLAQIDAFLAEADMPPSVFGQRALKDPRFVPDLRNGRNPTRRTILRAERYMASWRSAFALGTVTRDGDRRFSRTARTVPELRSSRLARQACRLADNNPRKAIELLRNAIQSIQPLAETV